MYFYRISEPLQNGVPKLSKTAVQEMSSFEQRENRRIARAEI